ncbi:CsbD-like protein [Rubellimicrobium mesophilum DSM 19309]|uniref:CsbD-like protein n=1 Tax=Rubellimicrobium mesophilum DSM 19309 TaxID=442562 RepID=A0A017HK37_9RHOB|nr:CsbD family protein [Rubellimicrobium mesophilum]EYD74867.1 CsbD-like protein [Rubellimicrobium mesophilum DSM 19309]
MSTSDEDRARGTARDVGGKIKEGLGKLTGDRELQSEGNLDQAKGKAQKAWGDLKDAVTPKPDPDVR